jgi:hypothetical protein
MKFATMIPGGVVTNCKVVVKFDRLGVFYDHHSNQGKGAVTYCLFFLNLYIILAKYYRYVNAITGSMMIYHAVFDIIRMVNPWTFQNTL